MDTFRFSGSYTTRPTSGNPSGDPEIEASIDERVGLANKVIGLYELTTDSPVSVGLGGLTGANVVIVKTVGGKARVRLTSSDGTTQAVPVDSLMVLITSSVAVTAIDLTRGAGVSTTVKVTLGQQV